MKNKVMIQCATVVNRDAVRRETIDGIEHIVINSMALPDNIVMNDGLYPADEINKSFESLERTLAPVEHPQDENGNYISASDPQAIHAFHAGAFNANVKKAGNRISIDKFINVQEAKKTDRGKRLLDRIEEIETNEKHRPIHTSVGVFLEAEALGEMKTNAQGQKYDWIARNMVFDHDAILLDSVAAATPSQGVGIAVNEDSEYEVQTFITAEKEEPRICAEGVSATELHQKVFDALQGIGLNVMYIEELFDEEVIFSTSEELFTVPYRVDNGIVTIVGIPDPVERVVSFSPKTNSKGEAMKDMIVNALTEAGIDIKGLDDDALFTKYNEHLQANQETGNEGNAEMVANAVTEGLKPVTEKLGELEGKINEQAVADVDKYAGIVANSDKYPGIDADSAKLLGLDKLKEMAANCGQSFGVSPVVHDKADDKFSAPAKMPGDK